jgi:hypothetical protein
MQYTHIIPATPGTYVKHYNAKQDVTKNHHILFWGAYFDEITQDTAIRPFVLDVENGEAVPLIIPEGFFSEGDGQVIHFHIGGLGRVTKQSFGEKKGFHALD